MKAAEEKKSVFVIDNLIDSAEGLATDAKQTLTSILSKALRHLPPPRAGFGAQVDNLFAAAKEGGMPGANKDRDAAKELIARADRTMDFIEVLRRVLDRAEESERTDRAYAYQIFVKYYSALAGVALNHVEVEKALAPVVEFMSIGPRKAKNEDKEPTPPAPVKSDDDNG